MSMNREGQTACQLERDFIEAMIEAIPGYVSWLSSDMTYLGVSQSILDTFGISREKIVGSKLGFLDQGDKSFVVQAKKFFDSSEDHIKFECILKVGEEVRWHLVQAKKYQQGKEAIFVGIDITDKKTAESKVEELQLEKEKSAKMVLLGEMSSNIAHEIKTPLSMILSMSEMLVDISAEPDKAETYFNKIAKTVERVSKTINSLRNYARGSSLGVIERVPLFEVVNDSVEICRNFLSKNGVYLHLEDISREVYIDCRPTEISQVLINLIKNSIDALETCDRKEIRIEVQETGKFLEIAVIDSGPGIPLEIQDKLTDAFFTTKPLGKGTGIGLNLSKKIMDSHSGSLFLDSNSEYTRFVIQIPKTEFVCNQQQQAA